MKAGIYRNPNNGGLAYIAKDRSARAGIFADGTAFTTTPEYRKEFRVRAINSGAQVEFEDGTRFDRVANVPNGCTDPAKALTDYQAALAEADAIAEVQHPELHKSNGAFSDPVVESVYGTLSGSAPGTSNLPRAVSRPAVLGVGYGENAARYNLDEEAERLTAEGWSVCHRQSARKHRRKGDDVLGSVFKADRFYWRSGLMRRMTMVPAS